MRRSRPGLGCCIEDKKNGSKNGWWFCPGDKAAETRKQPLSFEQCPDLGCVELYFHAAVRFHVVVSV